MDRYFFVFVGLEGESKKKGIWFSSLRLLYPLYLNRTIEEGSEQSAHWPPFLFIMMSYSRSCTFGLEWVFVLWAPAVGLGHQVSYFFHCVWPSGRPPLTRPEEDPDSTFSPSNTDFLHK